MALDYFAISSQGVYPTPTPSGALRTALAVSQGLLNIVLPGPPIPTGNIFNFTRRGLRRIFTQWSA